MANLEELANIVRNDGYSGINAEAKYLENLILLQQLKPRNMVQ